MPIPCPFDGKRAAVTHTVYANSRVTAHVMCLTCMAEGPPALVALRNTDTPAQVRAAIRKARARAIEKWAQRVWV